MKAQLLLCSMKNDQLEMDALIGLKFFVKGKYALRIWSSFFASYVDMGIEMSFHIAEKTSPLKDNIAFT